MEIYFILSNNLNQTPLHLAWICRRRRIVKMLLSRKYMPQFYQYDSLNFNPVDLAQSKKIKQKFVNFAKKYWDSDVEK